MKILLFILLLSATCHATPYIGKRIYGDKILTSINYKGEVTLNGTKVLGPTEITGRLYAKNATLKSLDIEGHVILDSSTVDGEVYINGNLLARSTQFKQDLSIAARKVIFDRCTLYNLRVRRIPGYKGPQTITLTNATVVKGSIAVDSGQGLIRISQDSIIPYNPGVRIIPY